MQCHPFPDDSDQAAADNGAAQSNRNHRIMYYGAHHHLIKIVQVAGFAKWAVGIPAEFYFILP